MNETAQSLTPDDRRDYHSYGNPLQIAVKDVSLDLVVSFEQKILKGYATLSVLRSPGYPSGPLKLDSRNLAIESAEASDDGARFQPVPFSIGAQDSILGSPLTVDVPPAVQFVRIRYSTDPSASGLQWLEPAQTAGGKRPFLYSQSEAIHARSWIPLQDSPGVRVTYSATVRAPNGMRAVMSAENDPNGTKGDQYRYVMTQAIPSYLIALAVGDIVFRPLAKRTGVWAEPSMIGKASAEFADIERMIQAAEELYGPYRWDRYDVLVLPPSFPYGGMENPRLTFLTPTIIAGDKSLVSVVSHELAHSWSGNLVTNATWDDFWLNEGFTTYIERRIQEKLYGPERAEMEALIERRELEDEMKTLEARDQLLHTNLRGRDPDGGSQVPYVKGMLFLRALEEAAGRDRFDSFLRGYFQNFALQSITTRDFVEYLEKNLLSTNSQVARQVSVKQWLYEPGLPRTAPHPQSHALEQVEQQSAAWQSHKIPTGQLPVKQWSTQETLHFLRSLPLDLNRSRMAELDSAFGFTRSGNAEILQQWLLMAVRSGYEPANGRLESFLVEVGRRKYLKPLYQELVKTPEGRKKAQQIYAKARPHYHPIAQHTVDELLK